MNIFRKKKTDQETIKDAVKRSPLYRMLNHDEMSDFGRQVVMAMTMEPDKFAFAEDLSRMLHEDFGVFTIYPDGTICHARPNDHYTNEGNKQRALTGADQRQLIREMVTLLQRPVPSRPAASAAIPTSGQMQAMNAAQQLQAMNAAQQRQAMSPPPPPTQQAINRYSKQMMDAFNTQTLGSDRLSVAAIKLRNAISPADFHNALKDKS